MKNRGFITSCLIGLWLIGASVKAQTGCAPQAFNVTMATPVSSRINWVGDSVEAILDHPLALSGQNTLPAGTRFKGKVSEVKPSGHGKTGIIRLAFKTAFSIAGKEPFSAQVATQDGWLRQSDRNTAVWELSPSRSTRLLNQKIEQRLGSNRAVWASVLGINENTIPQPSSDTFMIQYNRDDVMVGAGDTLKLRLACP